MLHLGVTAPRARPLTAATDANARGPVSMYVSTLGLTLANPTTILSFGALFAGLGLGGDAGESSAAPAMALGVFGFLALASMTGPT